MDAIIQKVQVRVPATSANMGPGFDCLGLALGLYLDLTATVEEGEGLEIIALGAGAGKVPLDERNAVYRGVARAYAIAGKTPRRLRLTIDSQIPLASGLGSSSAALVAGLAAGFVLSGVALDLEQVLREGVAIEGHPDNIAPCVMGGIVVAVLQGEQVIWSRIEPQRKLMAVVAVADFSLRTSKARKQLPQQVAREDAIFNLGRVGLLVAALANGDYELMQTAMQDRLHQPQREQLSPGMQRVLAAAIAQGALGAALSGAGPTLLALVDQDPGKVADAMVEAWAAEGIVARTMVLPLIKDGLQFERLM